MNQLQQDRLDKILNQTQGHGVTSKYTPIHTKETVDKLISKGYTVTATSAKKG